jgi:DNA-binding MarR family transcriptional regulator
MPIPTKTRRRIAGRKDAAREFSLPALLSQALVAYTIELDNEFERRMAHRTTDYGVSGDDKHAVWLTSFAMWANVMQYVRPAGISSGELYQRARVTKAGLRISLMGLRRWGYVAIGEGPSDDGQRRVARGWVIHPTAAGSVAQKIWQALPDEIERRWDSRFGNKICDELRSSLATVVREIDLNLPEYFPILRYGLFSDALTGRKPSSESESGRSLRTVRVESGAQPERPALYALLSKVLLAFTLDFEHESDVSLAMSANLVRVLAEGDVSVRDLPRKSGVSTEAITMALGYLEKRGFVKTVAAEVSGRSAIIGLTAKGRKAQEAVTRRLGDIEAGWRDRFGAKMIERLRSALEEVVGNGSAASPLFGAITPNPNGWRARVAGPATLPHQIMVLHRGGYPDGS